jgi:hypothetical protein
VSENQNGGQEASSQPPAETGSVDSGQQDSSESSQQVEESGSTTGDQGEDTPPNEDTSPNEESPNEEGSNTWRDDTKDGTFVEGIKYSGEHVHYDSSGGSDVPVNWKNETTGESVPLRTTPIGEADAKIEKEHEKIEKEQEKQVVEYLEILADKETDDSDDWESDSRDDNESDNESDRSEHNRDDDESDQTEHKA